MFFHREIFVDEVLWKVGILVGFGGSCDVPGDTSEVDTWAIKMSAARTDMQKRATARVCTLIHTFCW